ncbi:conserved hypothetical protein [Candidatus Sulfopaludibacter sp. SbA3]|nr:conserved hypothetical protein [Candidatus Sulfopaludibacter sp. SbA3]
MPEELYKRVLDMLWPPGLTTRTGVFAIVDSACDERIFGAVDRTYQPKECLYTGNLPWQLRMTAPYLVELAREDRFTRFLLEDGWGNSWSLFLRTETGFKQLRRHLRQFLRVRSEAGTPLIFRYYDPRVLRVYLPTCRPTELETFFGPIDIFLAEGKDPGEMLEFRHERNVLRQSAIVIQTSRSAATE